MSEQDWLTPGTLVISNGIYKVAVEDVPQTGGGMYTIGTASGHPKWPDQDIFYNGMDETPETTYSTIRSFTTQTDYTTFSHAVYTDPGYSIQYTGPASNTVQVGNAIQTTFVLTTPDYSDNLTIVQTITLHGTTFTDSTIEVTTAVTNTGPSDPVTIGIRYLWDFSLAGVDLSLFQQKEPGGSVLTEEADFSPVTFQYYKMTNSAGSPSMYIMGTANGPGSLVPVPTAPRRLVFANWDLTFENAFSYAITGDLEGDSCVLYYWGDRQEITIPPGGTASVTAILFELGDSAVRGVPFIH